MSTKQAAIMRERGFVPLAEAALYLGLHRATLIRTLPSSAMHRIGRGCWYVRWTYIAEQMPPPEDEPEVPHVD